MSQPGLRHRMRRAADQLREQHERLAPMFADLDFMLCKRRVRDAQTTAFRLQGALHAHFMLEQEIVFPFLRALRPDQFLEHETLLDDHRILESGFETMIDQILTSDFETATESLAAFRTALAEHEKREECLLRDAAGTK